MSRQTGSPALRPPPKARETEPSEESRKEAKARVNCRPVVRGFVQFQLSPVVLLNVLLNDRLTGLQRLLIVFPVLTLSSNCRFIDVSRLTWQARRVHAAAPEWSSPGRGYRPGEECPCRQMTPWHLGLLLELAFNSLGTYLSQVKCKMRMPPLG